MPTTRSSQTPPAKLTTLAIDVGGTGIKASVLDQAGHMEHDRVREDTPYPLSPEGLLGVIESLVAQLPTFDRVSLGFPGMVREGRILSAPHFVSPTGPEGDPSPKLVKAWIGCDLQGALSARLGKPTKVANDADQQGAAVVTGEGLELVMTLGTGVGSALFYHGRLCPHLELAHHPFNAKGTYNEVLGDATRKQVGGKKWNKRVVEMVDVLRALDLLRSPLHRRRQLDENRLRPRRRREHREQSGRHPRRHQAVGSDRANAHAGPRGHGSEGSDDQKGARSSRLSTFPEPVLGSWSTKETERGIL